MKYISTRGKAPVLNFEEAMLTGLARDGGLYVPQSIPNFSPDDISSMSDLSYEEIAFKVILPFVGDCFSDDELIKNVHFLLNELKNKKPESSKGIFLKKIFINTTMGPGLQVDPSSVM